MEQLDNLLDVWEKLGQKEKTVLLTFSFRMLAGQRKYGPLFTGKKDWAYEAIEEALDASVYLTAMLADKVDVALANAISNAEEEVKTRNAGWTEAEESVPDTIPELEASEPGDGTGNPGMCP